MSGCDMIDALKRLILNEDRKKPLTDQQLAAMLAIRRERVIALRLGAGIPGARQRRRSMILADCCDILAGDAEISDRKLARALTARGYSISRYAAGRLKEAALSGEGCAGGISPAKQREGLGARGKGSGVAVHEEPFQHIVGYDHGLAVQINQAKAAILYPPMGLHVLLFGPSGVGKSYLAERMYRFALKAGAVAEKAPFIVFNCADYADNPQLLLAQLFGHAKGAFSGAAQAKEGLVERADGGFLFLDEVHRLPSEGQEILFSILDRGEFRRLGESAVTKASVRVIAATTENLESALLLTFRRRIPMLIEIPPLDARPCKERYTLIKKFFKKEAVRVRRSIKVEAKAVKYLMVYPCRGNVGQLHGDIRVACANGFLNCVSSGGERIVIGMRELGEDKETGWMNGAKDWGDARRYFAEPILVSADEIRTDEDDEVQTSSFEKIYQAIEAQFAALRGGDLGEEEIYKIVQNRLNAEVDRHLEQKGRLRDLETLVDRSLLAVVRDIVQIAKAYLPELRERVHYFLAIHLSTLFERMREGKYLPSNCPGNAAAGYKREYAVAKIMTLEIEARLGFKMPKEEILLLAMYLKTFSQSAVVGGKVKVIVLSHGRVASAMAEVANRLLCVNDAVGIDVELDESPESALARTIRVVEERDEGKGCLLLVDMGSLAAFGEVVTKRTGIRTRGIGRVDTVMVLEAVRRAALSDMSLEAIEEALDVDKSYVGKVDVASPQEKRGALLMICITGEGTARRLRQYVLDSLKDVETSVEIFTLGSLERHRAEAEILRIEKRYRILAVVGAMRLPVVGAPFISVERILDGEGLIELRRLVACHGEKRSSLAEVIDAGLIACKLDCADKIAAIDHLARLLEARGAVSEEFSLSAFKRESIGATYLRGGIGIPHGDSAYVAKSAIAVASLVRPVLWEGEYMADLVCLFALQEADQPYVDDFYRIISNKASLDALKAAGSPEEMMRVLLGGPN